MSSILNWYVEEGTIFKGGSGSGINLSNIRSSMEPLAGGGTASGPVSFMRGADASAGTIKCLHADTDLVTDHGVVPIRTVRPGWQVMTRHGFRVVAAVHDNGAGHWSGCAPALGDEILCTPEHRFRVRDPRARSWREAGELAGRRLRRSSTSATPTTARCSGWRSRRSATGEQSPAVLDEVFAVWLGWAHGSAGCGQ